VDAQVPRSAIARLRRWLLRNVLVRRPLFTLLARIGRGFSWLLPATLRRQLQAPAMRERPAPTHPRRVLMLQGCVQPGLRPNINVAAARVLDRAGVSTIEEPAAGCCGALRFHAGAQNDGLDDMRRLIDAWWPAINSGVEAIVITASGCGAHIRDYGRLLRDDPGYADKAARVSALACDLTEFVVAQTPNLPPTTNAPRGRVAFQSPCTLQHGQRIRGAAESLLQAAGYELAAVADAHLCCGSAGTYSIEQPALARELRTRKLASLEAGKPTVIATANIGCLTHLAGGAATPVRHWIELLDEALD
jgi:glycolate oxidase iron-sulfur subunit